VVTLLGFVLRLVRRRRTRWPVSYCEEAKPAFCGQDDIVTVRQVAERWKCDEEVVYRLVRQGKLKGFRLSGGRRSGIRIRFSAVLAYEEDPPSDHHPRHEPPAKGAVTPSPGPGAVRGLRHLRRA
jgi:excisionase family DNA binding protein